MQASKSLILTFPLFISSTFLGQKATHIPHPLHQFLSTIRETSVFVDNLIPPLLYPQFNHNKGHYIMQDLFHYCEI